MMIARVHEDPMKARVKRFQYLVVDNIPELVDSLIVCLLPEDMQQLPVVIFRLEDGKEIVLMPEIIKRSELERVPGY